MDDAVCALAPTPAVRYGIRVKSLEQPLQPPRTGMRLVDTEGRRLYLTDEERRAFVAAAAGAPRERPAAPEVRGPQ